MKLTPATRPSTTARTLSDSSGLLPWAACTTLATVMHDPALRTQASLITDTSWHAWKPVYEAAQARRGNPEADHGTAIHAVLEALVNGHDISGVDPSLRADAEAAATTIRDAGYTVAASEQQVVVIDLPELHAGTRDLVLTTPDGDHVVADLKTTARLGADRHQAVSWAIQLDIYARGIPYTQPWDRDRWGRPLIDLTTVPNTTPDTSRTRGVVIEVERTTARTALHHIDLVAGHDLTLLALRVRAARKTRPIVKDTAA